MTSESPNQSAFPPVVINNNASSSASAAAAVHGGRGWPRYRRQSAAVHMLLFLTTAGLGNIVYAAYVSSWNRKYAHGGDHYCGGHHVSGC